MGVYTPDSTTNSVHSLHYGQCDLDVSQLGLESPASIASDLASQNSVERPPSALPTMRSQQQQIIQVPSMPTSSIQLSSSQSSSHQASLQAQQVQQQQKQHQQQQQQYVDCSMSQHVAQHVAIQQQAQHQMQHADKNPYVSKHAISFLISSN